MYYTETTNKIKITVAPSYQEDISASSHHIWFYTIFIENNSNELIQIISRFWKITEANGISKEIRGEGVVGQQPVIKPGEIFEYTSSTELSTNSGFMCGSYKVMIIENGSFFEAFIPTFSLDDPEDNISIN